MGISRLLAGFLALAMTPALLAQPARTTEVGTDKSKVGGRSLDEWKRDLSNPDPTIREDAIMAMVRFGTLEKNRDVVRILVRRCTDRDHSPRTRAVQALALVQVTDEDIPMIVESLARRLMSDPQVVVRYHAGVALTRFGEHCGPVMPMLIKGTQDPGSWRVRQVALMSVATAGRPETGPPDTRAIQASLRSLGDSALQVRIEGIRSLSYLGKPSDTNLSMAVEQNLRRFTQGRDKIAAIWAWIALMGVTEINTEAVKAISLHLEHEDARIRVAAVGALGMIEDRARFAIPNLLTALEDKDPQVVVATITTLANIEDPGVKTINALSDIISDQKPKEYLVGMKDETKEEIQKIAKRALDHIRGIKPEKKP